MTFAAHHACGVMQTVSLWCDELPACNKVIVMALSSDECIEVASQLRFAQ